MPLLDEIDAYIQTTLSTWVPVQEMYRAQHGRYMQVLRSHSVIPADGEYLVPDQLHLAPHYQQESLQALGFAADPLTAAFSVDQHGGPDGLGWTLSVYVTIADATWVKRYGHGAHSSSSGWHGLEVAE
jgi:hypothetical protein